MKEPVRIYFFAGFFLNKSILEKTSEFLQNCILHLTDFDFKLFTILN